MPSLIQKLCIFLYIHDNISIVENSQVFDFNCWHVKRIYFLLFYEIIEISETEMEDVFIEVSRL
jgi:hypothetical protein